MVACLVAAVPNLRLACFHTPKSFRIHADGQSCETGFSASTLESSAIEKLASGLFVIRARTHCIDSNAPILQVGCPPASKRADGGFCGAEDAIRRETL